MRIPLLCLLKPSPFNRAMERARKVGECGPLFFKAVEYYESGDRDNFSARRK